MYPCRNHPHQPATRLCSQCQQPFCEACLVEFMGHPNCGPCRDMRLQWMQRPAPIQQKNHYHELREKTLIAAAIILGLTGFVANLGFTPGMAVLGGLLVLVLLAALTLHIMGNR